MNLSPQFHLRPVLLSICRMKTTPHICSTHQLHHEQTGKASHHRHHTSSYSRSINASTSSSRIKFLTSYGWRHHYPSVFQLSSQYHTLQCASHRPSVLVEKLTTQDASTLRHKSKKKQRDTEEDSDSDIDDSLDDDDFEAPSQFKVQTIHSPSLRVDAILSKALGLSRNRLEEIFFGPGFLLNGEKLQKKAGKMDEGDYVDVVMEKVDDQVKVKRVKLLKVGSQKTSTDKVILKVRVWKNPFLIDSPNIWKPES